MTALAHVMRLARECQATKELGVLDLGRLAFPDAAELQHAFLVARQADPDAFGDVVLIVEHPPTLSITRRSDPRHVLWSEAELAAQGIERHLVDRGGDVTYHGPGQIVGYPLLDLRRRRWSPSRYVAALEEAVILGLRTFGLAGVREPGMTGVWVADPRYGRTAKICAIGVRVSYHLTKHGFSVNHEPDMSHFAALVPCGLEGLPVTSLRDILGSGTPTRTEVIQALVGGLNRALNSCGPSTR